MVTLTEKGSKTAATPKVSVIMPAFNTGRWIQQAIESALNQTVKELEVIVVDDGSTDDTVEVVMSIPDPRIRLFRQLENRGASAARNGALELARGRWAAILDSDDWFARRDRLEKMIAIGEEMKADVVADDLFLVDQGRTYAWATLFSLKKLRLRHPMWITADEFVRHDLGLIQPVVRLQFLREHHVCYDEHIHATEDWVFYMECLLHGARCLLVPWAGYAYRIRPGLLSWDVLGVLEQTEENLRRLLADSRVHPQEQLVKLLNGQLKKVRRNQQFYSVMMPLLRGDVARALGALRRSPVFPFLLAARLHRMGFYYLRRRFGRVPIAG